MKAVLQAVLCATLACAAAAQPAAAADVASQLKSDLQQYLAQHGSVEHVSAASLSVSLPKHRFIDVAAGTTAYGAGDPVTPQHLFQVGSNTKAFTAVLALKLEAQHKLAVGDTVGRWLPQYPAWKDATIHQLLDMTTGIPTYDGTVAWQRAMSRDPKQLFTPEQLIAYVDPKSPLAHQWLYSNTGYMLTELIEEKAAGRTYEDLVRNDVIAPTAIADLFYYPHIYPAELRARTVQGYFNNPGPEDVGLAPLIGRGMRDDSLSWARGAGAIVATPHAMAQWARALYRGDILTIAQRRELETIVSTKTADPISDVSADDPRGFGLGLARMYRPGLGAFWFYEGMTLGYRVVHAYFPEQNVVIAFGLNSQPPDGKNASGDLVAVVVKTLKANGLF
jgi:D-alanyl-D-alanine carboxypeptidase